MGMNGEGSFWSGNARCILTWGAVRRGELERAEGARGAALEGLWVWGRLKGCRRGLGLRLPSESLPWLLGGVGGKCRWSTGAAKKEAHLIHPRATNQDTTDLWDSELSTRGLHELTRTDLQSAEAGYRSPPFAWKQRQRGYGPHICLYWQNETLEVYTRNQ